VRVRFANAPEELTAIEGEILPFAFGAGENTLIDPDVRQFRYVIVYGGRATADVLQ
jgi:prolyl-tRNA editing enzyme YbaK/EbsC (Cys-tRNA(Pro) deacylase)